MGPGACACPRSVLRWQRLVSDVVTIHVLQESRAGLHGASQGHLPHRIGNHSGHPRHESNVRTAVPVQLTIPQLGEPYFITLLGVAGCCGVPLVPWRSS